MISAKRFYQRVRVVEDAAALGPIFRIALDDRELKTPAKKSLVLPCLALAEAIAAEWEAQQESIEPAAMPLTRLACTALDRVEPRKPDVVAEIARYGESDLLCYRATDPAELIQRQEQAWQPLLDWANQHLGLTFQVTGGVVPISQPADTLARLSEVVGRYDPFTTVALHGATTATGSVVLGLAIVERAHDVALVIAASEVDEAYQAELWGDDDEAVARRLAIREEISQAARLIDLIGKN